MASRSVIVLLFCLVPCLECQESQSGRFTDLKLCNDMIGTLYRIGVQQQARIGVAEQETERYRKENEALEAMWLRVMASFVALGMGIFAAYNLAKFMRKVWRFSPTGKQFAALVLGAVWISAAALISLNDSRLAAHPVNLVFTIFAYSSPAMLFAPIAVWWFGKRVLIPLAALYVTEPASAASGSSGTDIILISCPKCHSTKSRVTFVDKNEEGRECDSCGWQWRQSR